MAKKRTGETQRMRGMSYNDLVSVMTLETASVLTDYIRQYIGVATNTPEPGSGIFINWDRVLRSQMYQELAWYDLYDEVERDPHVSAVLRTLKLAVASRSWDVVPADDSARSSAIADFVKECLSGMENFTQDIYELLDAEGKGFSVSEVIWQVGYDSRPVSLMHRPQRRFQFDAATRELKLRTTANPYYGEPLPERKFIVHRTSAKYENPFGDALDQSLYWMWLFKKTVQKFWMTHLEVAMAPVPFIKVPSTASQELKNEADEFVAKIRRGAAGRISSNLEILWAEAKSSQQAADSYEKFVDMCNSEITKCVLGQVLTTEGSAKGGSGSRALGKVHGDVLAMRTMFSSHALEATLNGSLIKWIVDANYAGVDEYPRFSFLEADTSNRQEEATIVKTLADAGYSVTPEWVEEKFQVTLEEKQPVPAALQGQIPGQETKPSDGSEDPSADSEDAAATSGDEGQTPKEEEQ